MSQQIAWSELADAADRASDIWLGQPELRWFEEAWGVLANAGFARYKGIFAYHKVLFRFLALGCLYHDFCSMAWDVRVCPEYEYWLENIEYRPEIVWQMYSRLAEWSENSELDEALRMLSEDERPAVVDALMAGFGGTNGLYASLWRSTEDRLEGAGDDEEGTEPSVIETNDPFWPGTGAQMAGYGWVEQGCGWIAYD